MSALKVAAENRSGTEIDLVAAEALAAALLSRLGYRQGELGLAYVSADEMAGLNRQYMGKEYATDVLSFPLDSDTEGSTGELPVLLGDVIICPEVAESQALAGGAAAELCFLLIHGLLHIAGYDHERDSGEMERLQEKLAVEFCGA